MANFIKIMPMSFGLMALVRTKSKCSEQNSFLYSLWSRSHAQRGQANLDPCDIKQVKLFLTITKVQKDIISYKNCTLQ